MAATREATLDCFIEHDLLCLSSGKRPAALPSLSPEPLVGYPAW